MSQKTTTCKKCKKNYKVLTKGNLCACCFKKVEGYWANEFCGEEERERRRKGAKLT